MSTANWYVAGAGALAGGAIAAFAWPADDIRPEFAPLLLLAVGVAMALLARQRHRHRKFH